MVEKEPKTSNEQQAGIAEWDGYLAFVYANWALNHNLSPDDPVDEALLTRLVIKSTELRLISEADQSKRKLRVGALLADPEIRRTKFDEAHDFKKRQKEMSEKAARMSPHGKA